MAAQDFEFTDDMVIDEVKGDFNVTDSNQQHIEHILTANKGHFYEFPDLGANSKELLNSDKPRARINQIIKAELEKDDYTVKDIIIERSEDGTAIQVDAKRRK